MYVTYIESSPERVWEALTDPGLTAQYWGHSNVSDWQVGSHWEHQRTDGSGIADVAGTVLESVPPRRLAMTFDSPGEVPPGGPSKVTFDIEPYHEIIRLTVTHENLADEDALEAVSAGMAGRVRQPQVSAGDRPRAAPRALGDARRAARRPDGPQND